LSKASLEIGPFYHNISESAEFPLQNGVGPVLRVLLGFQKSNKMLPPGPERWAATATMTATVFTVVSAATFLGTVAMIALALIAAAGATRGLKGRRVGGAEPFCGAAIALTAFTPEALARSSSNVPELFCTCFVHAVLADVIYDSLAVLFGGLVKAGKGARR